MQHGSHKFTCMSLLRFNFNLGLNFISLCFGYVMYAIMSLEQWEINIAPRIKLKENTSICCRKLFLEESMVLIGHFTVMDGSEAGDDFVLIQTFLLYYANQVILMLTSIF